MAATSAMTFLPSERRAEASRRRVRRGGKAVAAMVVRVGVEAALGQKIGEARIARRVLGKAVIDLHDGAGRAVRQPRVEVERRAGRRSDVLSRRTASLAPLLVIGAAVVCGPRPLPCPADQRPGAAARRHAEQVDDDEKTASGAVMPKPRKATVTLCRFCNAKIRIATASTATTVMWNQRILTSPFRPGRMFPSAGKHNRPPDGP